MGNSVLIVSYYWPPAGGIGVQRWLQFAQWLPKFNWQPIIFTPENPSYPILDESLILQIPLETTVIKTPIWEPYALAEKFSRKNKDFKSGQFNVNNPSLFNTISVFIRGNFFIPDARKFWVKPSVRYLQKYIEEHSIENLITTGPPHSMHLIGKELKLKNPHLKWIADFRDPWTDISYHKYLRLTPASQKKHLQLENEVLTTADIITAASFTDAENYRKKGARKVESLLNGYRELDETPRSENSQFIISYIGVLEQLRNPFQLWNALEELWVENEAFRNHFQLQFVGKIDAEIVNYLTSSTLKNYLKLRGYVDYSTAQKFILQSDLLLITNFDSEESKGIIPGKLFEYLASRNPILSIGPKEADVQKILEETQAGNHYAYDEKEAMKEYILERFLKWKNGTNRIQSENIESYSRENITEKLVSILQN